MFQSQERISTQIKHLMGVFLKSEAEIRPHFMLTGPSGSGKSFLTKMIAEDMRINYFEINAAQLTSEGVSGNSLSKALRPLRQHWDKPNVIFVDEFDKLFQRGGESSEGWRSAVQDEFLHVLEADNASVFTDYGKYEPVPVKNTLFVFAGAFSNQKITNAKELLEVGMRREFVGRVPLVFCTQAITLAELQKVLPKVVLFQKYMTMFPQVKRTYAVRDILVLLEKQIQETDLGARLLHSCIHQYFMKDI